MILLFPSAHSYGKSAKELNAGIGINKIEFTNPKTCFFFISFFLFPDIYISFLALQFLLATVFFFHHSHVFFLPPVLRYNSSLSSFCISLSSLKQVSIWVFLVWSPFSCLSFSSLSLLVPFADGTPSILFCDYVSFFYFYTCVPKSNIQAISYTATIYTLRR